MLPFLKKYFMIHCFYRKSFEFTNDIYRLYYIPKFHFYTTWIYNF